MATLKIDNMEVTAEEGTLIIEAARSAGIEIPHFCYYPKLSIQGSCRMCLVEVKGVSKLVTSCTTPVKDGMIIHTGRTSKIVKDAQETMLAFFLINHPLDCPVCDKGGECPLQNYTYKYGPGRSMFHDEKWHFKKPVDLSSFIVLDRERCILCTRCIRFQEEIAFQPELMLQDRGRGSYIDAPGEKGFSSLFSGNTIELCPVGALTSRPFRFRARPWELKRVPSICPHCACGCNLYIDVRENRVMRVVSRENREVDDGWLCDRGRFGYFLVGGPERLKTPMIKRGNDLQPCTTEEAISFTVKSIKDIMIDHGGNAIGGLVSPRLTNEELFIFGKFMKSVIGSENTGYIPIQQQYREVDMASLKNVFRFSFTDIDRADTIFLLGIDPGNDLPILDLRIKKAVRRGVRLFTAGLSKVELSRFAVKHIDLQEGLRTLLTVLTREALQSERLLLLMGGRINPEMAGTVYKSLRESKEKKEGGWIGGGFLLPETNAQGAIHMGLLPQNIEVLASGVKGLILVDVDMPVAEDLRGYLDLLVVYSPFLTPAARIADVIFPSMVFAEKDGTFTSAEERVQKLFKAVRPPGDARNLWEVITMMACAMETPWHYTSYRDIMEEIACTISGYQGISHETIGLKGIYVNRTT